MDKVIRESTLRRIVKTLLEDKSLGPAMISVNPVVDPSAALTDPANPSFKPSSKAELKVAMSSLINNLSDDDVGDVYDSLKSKLNTPDSEEKKEMKKDTKTEQLVRLSVRKMLKEISKKKEAEAAKMWASMPSSEEARAAFLASGGKITKLPPEARGIAKGPSSAAVKSLRTTLQGMKDEPGDEDIAGGRNLMVADVGGMGLKDLAAEFGFKNPNGVLQWINKVIDKARTRTENFEELQVATLEALNDYIEELSVAAEPELTPDDVQLMKDNPQIVAELDSFKVYLSKKLRQLGM